ncbi:F-box domain-containing protein [Mycena venus]|uniref:F-box domain-containing protein n=1 Tax=Mycena venus TaxID=2733690 RepID=A0A8H6X4Q0_9AGAR|nr:F-box domain-containing protein [Mycena venus]
MLSALAGDRRRIADLDARIQDLERALAVLRLEKAVVAERLDSYKYPILSLPTEIISEIFVHFLPTYPLCPPLTGIFSPTLLTHICHDWREMALETPALWRAISLSWIHVRRPRRELSKAAAHSLRLARIEDMLTRSRSCPLSIQMNEWEDEDTHESQNAELLAAVLPHCARWEYVTLHLSENPLPSNPEPMSLLRQLDLWLYPNSSSATDVVFSGLPLLRTVILDDMAALHVTLPWAQLTSLTLQRVYLHECVPILQQTLNILHCQLELFLSELTDNIDITLPRVRELTLKDPSVGSVKVNYLQAFIVPALCTLEIPERFLGTAPIETLAAFISASGCELQEIRVTEKRGRRGEVPTTSYRTAFPAIPIFSFDREDSNYEESEEGDSRFREYDSNSY